MTIPGSRIPSMDMLRGCAVMGILLMNIVAFGQPSQAYFNPAAAGALSPADIAAWFATFVLVDSKMRALFSMLFGASMLLLIDRAEMAGRNGPREQMVRAFWLLLIGMVHYVLLWWGDILMIYAIVGLIAMPFARMEPMRLAKFAFLAFLVHFLLVTAMIAGLCAWRSGATAPDAPADIARGYADFLHEIGAPGGSHYADKVALYRSGFDVILREHLQTLASEWPRTAFFSFFDTLGFMLMGMAMLKGGFLTGRWEADAYLRTARHCFLIGLPPMIALGLWVVLSGFDPLAAFGSFIAWTFPFRIPLAVGWAALLLWLFARHAQAPLFARIAAAGRLALSNYLGTSLVMSALFNGWGLGQFGRIGHGGLFVIALGGCAIMLLWSPWWDARFAMGPAEWVWRSLSRGRMQSFRKNI